jgi:hypothetical protein
MSTTLSVLLTGLLLLVISLTAVAAAKRPAGMWNLFHFDGNSFVAGQSADGAPDIAVQAGVRPVLVKKGEQPAAVALAAGTGALAGICFAQRSGGKLKRGPGFLPYAGMPVQISVSGKVVATVTTDDQGYFQAIVAAGRYRVEARAAVEVTVENGATTLIPLRAGKRMAD